jgi:ribosomal-protein-alanine N-acetyltransferase
MVSPAHWGRGYASEAAARLVDHIFEEARFSAIVARCMTANGASAGVLRKLGFRRER